MNHEATLVAIHDVIAANEEGTEVLLRRSSRSSTNTTSHVIGEMTGSVEDIKTSVLSWHKLQNGWTFKDLAFGDGDGDFDCNQIAALLAGLTDAGAFPNNVQSLGYTAHPDQVALLAALEAEAYGCVKRSGVNDIRWFLTGTGVSQMATTVRVQRSKEVFGTPPLDTPIGDLDTYEALTNMASLW